MIRRITPFRFSLRTLLVSVVIAAILAAVPELITWTIHFAWLTGPIIGLCVFAIVANKPRTPDAKISRQRRVLEWFLLSTMVVFVVATGFANIRWQFFFHATGLPRGFPYPDPYLMQIHDWWERLHPPPPGFVKLHGEYNFVLQLTNAAFFIAQLLFFAAAGYVFRSTQRGDSAIQQD